MRSSIRLKLVGFTMGVVLLVGGAIFLHGLHLGRVRILTDFETEARETTGLISGSLADDLYFLNIRSLRGHLENARVNPDVASAYVMDAEGVILSDGTQENALRDSVPRDAFSHEVLRSSAWISRLVDGLLNVGGPVLLPDGRRIGHLVVIFSLERVNRIVRDTAKASLYLTLLCFGLGAALAYLAATWVTRPLSAITQAAREIGQGRLESRVALGRTDELGVLAESINQMARDLRTTTVSRTYLDQIVTSMGDALIVLGPDGTIQRVNPAASRLSGYAEAELIGRPLAAICPDGSVEEGGAGERTVLAKDGRRIPVSFSVSAMRGADGVRQGSVVLAQDITGRKQAEEARRLAFDQLDVRVRERTAELAKANAALEAEVAERRAVEQQLRRSEEELRALNAHLEAVREEERSRVSREIHDQLGQTLTCLRMDLAWSARRAPEDWAILQQRLGAMASLVDGTIKSVRRIYTDLRPSMLDDLGLSAALEWQTQEFQARTGIGCDFAASPPEIVAEADVATALFRICQEILSHVTENGHATRVHVRLTAAAEHILLTVEDNGARITKGGMSHDDWLGLLAMRERASWLGGEFVIAGWLAQGTSVRVRIPRDPRREDAAVEIGA